MTRGERTRVAAYALSTDESGRILLCRIAPSVAPGQIWTLPGGGLDFGEPPDVAVLRELAEESGYEGEVVGLADVADRVVTDSDGGGRMHAIRIVYRVRVTGGELRDEVDGSTDTCAWFTPEEASRLNLGALAKRALTLAAAEEAETTTGATGGRRDLDDTGS
jgi:8-oxo-dGTP diphosphatase